MRRRRTVLILLGLLVVVVVGVLTDAICWPGTSETTENTRRNWNESQSKVVAIHFDSRGDRISNFDAQEFGFDGYAEITDPHCIAKICEITGAAVNRSRFYHEEGCGIVFPHYCIECLGAQLTFHDDDPSYFLFGLKKRSLNDLHTTMELSESEYDELCDALREGIENAEVKRPAQRGDE